MRQKKERTLFSFGKHSSLPSLTRSSKPHLPQFPAAVHQSQPVFHNRLSSSPYITSHSQSSSFKLQGHTLWVKMALWRVRSASSIFINNILHRSAIFNTVHRHLSTDVTDDSESLRKSMTNQLLHMDINSLVGSCMPLAAMRIGTIIHNIEMNPGQGGKLVRAAGTSARILKEPLANGCLIRLPSGAEKWIDSKCRATIGTVSNPSHKDKKLRKAGQSRWLGRRPVVRGVAMNPVDHPHGGGEGRSKSSGAWGRTSQTPWGKPTKGGYKTGPLKRRK